MQINWFTVIAQIINFMVLVWLMKRYLYKPVLKAVDVREKKIKEQLENAAAKEAEAIREKEDFISKNKNFELKKNEMLSAATNEVNAQRTKMLDEVRKEASELKEKMQLAFLESQKDLNNTFEKKIRGGVFSIANKTLADLASTTLEEEMLTAFINKLEKLNNEDLKKIKESFSGGENKIHIQTVFSIETDQKNKLNGAIEKSINMPADIEYTENNELISGIELSCGGFKLSWSIKEYIDTLQKETESLLKGNIEA